MRIFLSLIMVLLLSCGEYKSFIAVSPRADIPDGSKEFLVYAPLNTVKDSLKAATIGYIPNDVGLNTEQIIIDEGTKAEYRVYTVDSASVRVVPYWGFTEKVDDQVRFWTGIRTNTEEMKRIIYNKNEGRPKKVFDYGAQVFSRCGKLAFK